jgi:hypothetical protein
MVFILGTSKYFSQFNPKIKELPRGDGLFALVISIKTIEY